MSPVDLSTELAELWLPNPVMTAAGCGGSGPELEPFVVLHELGALVTRSVWLDPRAGGPPPRLVETPSGMLTDGGGQSAGVDAFLARELTWLAQRGVRTVVSVAGASLAEYAELAGRVGHSPGVAAVEVNLDVPWPDTQGRALSAVPFQAAKVAGVVRREVPGGLPVLVKLSADVADVVAMAEAVTGAGADGLVLINSVPGLCIDPGRRAPALPHGAGGLGGPAIRPIGVGCVWRVHAALPDVPLVGVGGIASGSDALEYLLAGACAVQVGTATLHDPSAPARVLAELGEELDATGTGRLRDLVGAAHGHEGAR